MIYHPKKIDQTSTVSMFRNADHNFLASHKNSALEKIVNDI